MKVCIEQGCTVLVEKGPRCPACTAKREAGDVARRERKGQYEASRPNAQQRGYGERHRQWRALVLGRDRECQGWPHGVGCGSPTTVADHIVPIRQGGKRFCLKNGRGMCDPCHNRKRQSESNDAKRAKKRG